MKKIKNIQKIKKELENKKELVRCAKEFGILGDLNRLKICYLLCKHKELSVSEIAEILGVSVSAVSHTLKKLKEINLVKSRKIMKNVYYRINPKPVIKLIEK
ncbi:Transcriptional repressor SmtB [bacterium HR34]|nr:Transcriptional repressor SmtB [bacterium HR34]